MDILNKQIESGSLSHSYILQSRSLDIAMDKAMDLAKDILEKEKDPRVFQNDLFLVEADGANIKIESIREMIKFFSTRPFFGAHKLAIIKDGAKLNQVSSNAMLKILEELPDYGKIIILVRNAYSLLPTIRSRCQIVNIKSNFDYSIDKNLVEGLIDSFLMGDLTGLAKNREEIEAMKDHGEEFFALSIDYLTSIMGKNMDKAKTIEGAIARAVDLGNNLKRNVNFLLSVEVFALSFIE